MYLLFLCVSCSKLVPDLCIYYFLCVSYSKLVPDLCIYYFCVSCSKLVPDLCIYYFCVFLAVSWYLTYVFTIFVCFLQ